jgi:DNA-binding IclR family transcriptional regulator
MRSSDATADHRSARIVEKQHFAGAVLDAAAAAAAKVMVVRVLGTSRRELRARPLVRRALLVTAGGKALLAERSDAERAKVCAVKSVDRGSVDQFLAEYEKKTRIAKQIH